MYKKDTKLNEIVQHIKESINNGYELELSIDYNNNELTHLPKEKFYKTEEVKGMDYINFISGIYNHFRSIEREQLYEFQAEFEQWENDDMNFYYRLCAMRPFGGSAGYKYGGGSGTFSMRIFLTNRKLLLFQLQELQLPNVYEKIGIKLIENEHPYYLSNILSVKKYIKDTISKNIVGQLIENNEYELQNRKMKFEELKELVVANIVNNNYSLNDFEINIEEDYDDFYFKISNQYLGKIVSIVQRKEITIDYYLNVEYEEDKED